MQSHDKRIRFKLQAVCLSCLLGITNVALAEQLHIAVIKPEVVADNDEARKTAEGCAALWQSLLSVELGHREWFAVVEREDLPAVLQQWEWAGSQGALSPSRSFRPELSGADCLVIGRLTFANEQYAIALKMLNTGSTAIEQELTEEFSPELIEASVKRIAARLQSVGLTLLSRREIHSVLSILDFENHSPFDRNRWQERAIARRLIGFFQRQPGVLVLEREEVDALWQEIRLRRGGLAQQTGAVDRDARPAWSQVANIFLLSGTLSETQPQGQPLKIRVGVTIRNLATEGSQRIGEIFPVTETVPGLARLVEQIRRGLQADQSAVFMVPSGTPDRSAEALELANKAVRLLNEPSIQQLDQLRQVVWELNPAWFGLHRHAGDSTPERKASVMRAVQYLKAALVADDRNGLIKAFLCSVLADRQVSQVSLSVELAEEVGWQHPEHQARAWAWVSHRASEDKRRYYRQLLMEKHPGTWQAKVAAETTLAEISFAHRGNSDLSEMLAAMQPHVDKILKWVRHGGQLEPLAVILFEATQVKVKDYYPIVPGRFEWRPVSQQTQGERFLEETLARQPQHDFYVRYYWTDLLHRFHADEAKLHRWIRLMSDSALKTDRDPWTIGVRADRFRIMLAQSLMDQDHHQEALALLELVSNYHHVGGARFMIGECAFALGDYARALTAFETFGSDHREAIVWVDKCRAKLGMPPRSIPAKAYAVATNEATWRAFSVPLPPGVVTALEPDGPDVWIGLTHWQAWSEHNLLMLQNSPSQWAEAHRQGGLVRWRRDSRKADYFKSEDGLPHPWITCLAATPSFLCAGTLGGGLALMNKATGEWSAWTETNGLPFNTVTDLETDGTNLWVALGRHRKGGVAQYNFRTGQWQSFLPGDYPNQTGPPTTFVQAIKLIAGRVWCSVPGVGILIYNPQQNTWEKLAREAFFVVEHVGDRLWFGLGNLGLASSDLAGEDWQVITLKDGLPMPPCALGALDSQLVIGSHGVLTLNSRQTRFTLFPLDIPIQFPSCPAHSGLLFLEDQIWLIHGHDGVKVLDIKSLSSLKIQSFRNPQKH